MIVSDSAKSLPRIRLFNAFSIPRTVVLTLLTEPVCDLVVPERTGFTLDGRSLVLSPEGLESDAKKSNITSFESAIT
ncbi:hypothetical protein VCHA50P415_40347 [Vibrio chagasii]|nr:hypothetical protein VCHA50P415_40347 [Vibrio chagasii]